MTSTESRQVSASAYERVAVAASDGLFLGGEPLDDLIGQPIAAVASDGASLWALADRRDLFRVEAGSAEHVTSLEEGRGVCIHTHRGQVLVGGEAAGLWTLADRRLQEVASFEQAPTRTDWHTPWGGPASVFSMASHGEDLYVSVHVGGILHSDDGGESWTATIDLHEDVHQVVVDPDVGTVWAATGTSGLAASSDRGRTWSHHTDGLHATYLLAVAITSAGVLVAASSGHAGEDGAVYLFDGSRFQRPAGLPDTFNGAVGPRHVTGEGDFAAVLAPSGLLFVSEDGGWTWHHAGGPFASPTEVHMTPAP